jgi:hypothetical protein
MQPPPPDTSTQQLNTQQTLTHSHKELTSPLRKQLQCVNPLANSELSLLLVYNPSNDESGFPASRLFQDLAITVNSYTHLESNTLDNNIWYEICKSIALSISDSISYMEYGNDIEDTRAVRKAMKNFSSLANAFTKEEDTDMDQDLDPAHLLPPPALPSLANGAILSILRDIQSNNKNTNDHMIHLENQINRAAKHQDDRRSKPNGPSNTTAAMSPTNDTAAAADHGPASYAKVTATNVRPRDNAHDTPTNNNPASKSSTNSAQHQTQPIRYVVCYLGNPPSQDQRLLPKIIQ